MSELEELMVYITTNDRLHFLKFRNRYVRKYGQDEFTELLNRALESLKGE